MKSTITAAGICLVAVLTSGCSGTGLTRGQAKRVLEKDASFAEVGADFVPLTEESAQAAERAGLWTKKATYIGPMNVVTPKGSQRGIELVGTSVWIHLAKPAKREVVEITGIADGDSPKAKVVEFTFRSTPAPEGLSLRPGSGRAEFKLFDDGWRVVAWVPAS
jgi:hypothetical protein